MRHKIAEQAWHNVMVPYQRYYKAREHFYNIEQVHTIAPAEEQIHTLADRNYFWWVMSFGLLIATAIFSLGLML